MVAPLPSLRTTSPRFAGAIAAAAWLLALSGCAEASPSATASGEATGATPAATTAPTAAPSVSASIGAANSGTFDANGHSLFMTCVGTGSPTIVIEAGEGQLSDEMNQITPALVERGRVCSYDRANLGQSGPAPTPRTARDVVDDLHALLGAAAVPGPYLLIGHSGGGAYVQLYPRVYPTEVAGVLITNPVPPCAEWMEKGFLEMSASEQADELAYLAGENPETIDWCESSEQISALPAPSMPVEVLISTIAQCASVSDICGRTYPAYTEIMRDLADSWPAGHFSQVESIHSIYARRPDDFLAVVDALLDRIASP